jgi:hypothetical protein
LEKVDNPEGKKRWKIKREVRSKRQSLIIKRKEILNSFQEGLILARKLGCDFFEASAKKRINVEEAFYDVMRLLKIQRQITDINFGDG